MAFDLTPLMGTGELISASSIEGVNGEGGPNQLVANPDGSFTLNALNKTPYGSLQDANNGFPGPITAGNPLGLPGTFQFGDIAGINVKLYSGGALPIVEFSQTDYQGKFNPAFFVGAELVGYNPIDGFLLETLDGFVPGVILGTLSGIYNLYAPGFSLNNFDAAGNIITPNYPTLPVTFEPVSFNFPTTGVPEPSMGLVVGLAILATVASRAFFGRSGAV